MHRPRRPLRSRRAWHNASNRLGWLGVSFAALVLGCAAQPPPKKPVQLYPNLGMKKVPEYLRGTIYERVELGNTRPFEISGYGLVVNLDHTGSSQTVPGAVKAYMIKEMVKRGFGSKMIPGFEQ